MGLPICLVCGIVIDLTNAAHVSDRRAIRSGCAPKYALCKKCSDNYHGIGLLASSLDRPLMTDECPEMTAEQWSEISSERPEWYPELEQVVEEIDEE